MTQFYLPYKSYNFNTEAAGYERPTLTDSTDFPSGTVFDIDFSQGSYDAAYSSVIAFNKTASPADGSEAWEYDWRFGNGIAASTMPTYSSAHEAIVFTSSQVERLELYASANTQFLNDLHKTDDQGKNFTYAALVNVISSGLSRMFLETRYGGGTSPGATFFIGDGDVHFKLTDASAQGEFDWNIARTSGVHLFVVSYNASSRETTMYLDGATSTKTLSPTSTSSNPQGPAWIGGSEFNTTNSLMYDERLHAMSMFNRILTQDEEDDLRVAYETRTGLSFTNVSAVTPVNTSAPTISGSPNVGQDLTCTPGDWTGPNVNYNYQWRVSAVDVSGATSSVYTILSVDVGSSVDCIVTGYNTHASAAASTNSITVAAAGTGPTVTGLKIDFALGSWVGIRDFAIMAGGVDIMNTTLSHDSSPTAITGFGDLSDDTWGTDSSFSGADATWGDSAWEEGTDPDLEFIHWSTSAAYGGIIVYAKFAASTQVDKIKFVLRSASTYGFPVITIEDASANDITSLATVPTTVADQTWASQSDTAYVITFTTTA